MEQILYKEDDSDIDVLLLTLVTAYENQIERPIRRQITREGHVYIQKALKENPHHFRQLYRMYPDVFADLCYLIRMKTDLRNTRHMYVEEMLATFLMTVGQSSKYCHTIDIFKRSKFTASTNFYKILRALNTLAPSLMAKPTHTVPQKISTSTRFYPYFKVQNFVYDSFFFQNV